MRDTTYGISSMQTTSHNVDLCYTRQELDALFTIAHAEDVERGGRYDARGGAINVWSHHWTHSATRAESEIIGNLYVNWLEDRIWCVECNDGFALEDLLHELAILEQKSLGDVKHGRLLKTG